MNLFINFSFLLGSTIFLITLIILLLNKLNKIKLNKSKKNFITIICSFYFICLTLICVFYKMQQDYFINKPLIPKIKALESLKEEVGTIKKIKSNNFFDWLEIEGEEGTFVYKVKTDKGNYKVKVYLIMDDSNEFKITKYIINNKIIQETSKN